MDKKQMLLNLVEKYRDVLRNNREYMICNQVLRKIDTLTLTYNSDEVKLDLNEISNLTEEEISMFESAESLRIIAALKSISSKKGWRMDSVRSLIFRLKQDIIENKMSSFNGDLEKLDEVSKIIREGLFDKNYNLILEFIRISVDNNMLSYKEGFELNFYILKECSVKSADKDVEGDVELIELRENIEPSTDIRNQLQEIFANYGYTYDVSRLGELEDKLIRYVDVSYVDYILSKFKDYGIDNNELYVKKRVFYRILIDHDKDAFDAILKFIDEEKCSLRTLLCIPSVFVRRRKNYIERNKLTPGVGGDIIEICGSHQDFFDNIELYKKLSGVTSIKDSDLDGIGKFLCTPSSLIMKNLLLLRRYGIVSEGKLPKAIISLCGNNTEYIIDRFIEASLYDSYLTPRYTVNGEFRQPRGTYLLDGDNNPLKFYKMKRAKDFGDSVLASNAGIRSVFRDDNESYMGISRVLNNDGKYSIVQETLSLETMRGLAPSLRRELPDVIKRKIVDDISPNLVYFDNLYKYREVNPIEIFASSDEDNITILKGERVNTIFSEDYKKVFTDEEMIDVSSDSFIKLLDSAIYCDSDGDSKKVKKDRLRYEFSHPKFPNVSFIVSRYKVLRLCKLLKERGSWITDSSSNIDKENTLLSVLVKDSIISDVELMMLRVAIRTILVSGIIKVPEISIDVEKGRGAK